MNKKIKICIMILLFLVSILLSSDILFAASGKYFANLFSSQIIHYQEDLGKIQINAAITMGLVLAIGIIGVVIGCLQRYKFPFCTHCVVILGALVSIFTLINNTIYEFDHRDYKKKAVLLERNIENIQQICDILIEENDPDEIEKQILQIKSYVANINSLRTDFGGNIYLNGFKTIFNWVRSVFAEDLLPAWVENPPKDTRNLYFVGHGQSDKYSIAMEQAKNNAQEKIQYYLQNILQEGKGASGDVHSDLNLAQLSKYLAASGIIQISHVIQDKNDGLIEGYVLMKISREFLPIDMQFFAFKNNTKLPQNIIDTMEKDDGKSQKYITDRMELRKIYIDYAKKNLLFTDELNKIYKNGNDKRYNGNFELAIAEYDKVIEASPNFYLPYFAKAMTLEKLDRTTEAKQNYIKAILYLENNNLTDPSVYNTYGFFLCKTNNQEEGKEYFKKTLEIDPLHPSANKVVELIKKVGNLNSSDQSQRENDMKTLLKDNYNDPFTINLVLSLFDEIRNQKMNENGVSSAVHFIINSDKSVWTEKMLKNAKQVSILIGETEKFKKILSDEKRRSLYELLKTFVG